MTARDLGMWAWLHSLVQAGEASDAQRAQWAKLGRKVKDKPGAYAEWRARRIEDLDTSRRIVDERRARIDAGEDLTATERRTLSDHVQRVEAGEPPEYSSVDAPKRSSPMKKSTDDLSQAVKGGFGWGIGLTLASVAISVLGLGAAALARMGKSDDDQVDDDQAEELPENVVPYRPAAGGWGF